MAESQVMYRCCACYPDPDLDANTLVLFNRECARHGRGWHRELIQHENGRLRLRFPLDPNGPIFEKH